MGEFNVKMPSHTSCNPCRTPSINCYIVVALQGATEMATVFFGIEYACRAIMFNANSLRVFDTCVISVCAHPHPPHSKC